MKPTIHAESSAKKFGGKLEDYLRIHDWFDQTKAHFPTNAHRSILHNSFGIFLAEQMFGHTIKNSDGKEVSVRDIGEQHVIEDLGFIPTLSDYLQLLEYQDWMSGKGLSPSQQGLKTPTIGDKDKIIKDLQEKIAELQKKQYEPIPLDPFTPLRPLVPYPCGPYNPQTPYPQNPLWDPNRTID